jgi:hypothetical protein
MLEPFVSCGDTPCFAVDFEPAVFRDFPLRDWLRTFGVIRDRRTSGNSINRAVRLLILEKSLPCPMP